MFVSLTSQGLAGIPNPSSGLRGSGSCLNCRTPPLHLLPVLSFKVTQRIKMKAKESYPGEPFLAEWFIPLIVEWAQGGSGMILRKSVSLHTFVLGQVILEKEKAKKHWHKSTRDIKTTFLVLQFWDEREQFLEFSPLCSFPEALSHLLDK